MKPIRLMAALAAFGLIAGAPQAMAQADYPTRSIKFVVPFAAGSGTDTLARVIGQHMSQTLGQAIVVENIPGGSGQIAARNAANAAADGYTLFVTSSTTHAANQSLYKTLTYDPVKDFEPVSKLGNITLALVVHPTVPVNDVGQLIAYAKANPGKLSFGSGSSSSRIAGEMLKTLAGIDMLHVAYKSNPQAITDLLGGQISLVFADVSTTLPQVKAGKVRGLAVSSVQRSPLAPDLPTMGEAGVKGYDLTAWFASFVPAKTPKQAIDKLHAATVAALKDKGVSERLLSAGIEPESSTPDELRAYVVSETKKWAEIVRAAGIQPE